MIRELQISTKKNCLKLIYIYRRQQTIIYDLRLMEHCNNRISKIINLLDNTINEPTKFRTKTCLKLMMHEEPMTKIVN